MRLTLSLFLALCAVKSCSEPEVSEPAPQWLKGLIATHSSEPVANPPRSVWRALFNNQVVYYVPPICCDQVSTLYDSAGNVLCAPDGGLTGKGDGRCSDFGRRSTDRVLIWRDTRTRR